MCRFQLRKTNLKYTEPAEKEEVNERYDTPHTIHTCMKFFSSTHNHRAHLTFHGARSLSANWILVGLLNISVLRAPSTTTDGDDDDHDDDDNHDSDNDDGCERTWTIDEMEKTQIGIISNAISIAMVFFSSSKLNIFFRFFDLMPNEHAAKCNNFFFFFNSYLKLWMVCSIHKWHDGFVCCYQKRKFRLNGQNK